MTDTPQDLATAYGPGRYIAQVQGLAEEAGVLYASAVTAPVDDAAYFHAPSQTFFTFCVDGETHTWVKVFVAGTERTLAVALYAEEQ